MKKHILMLLGLSLLISCSSVKNTSSKQLPVNQTNDAAGVVSGGDGLSYETAIIILEKTEMPGIAAEYTWIRKNYPNSTFKMQSLNYYKNKPYDILSIVTTDGRALSIYFDISNFYGHF